MRPRQPRSWIITIALVSGLLYSALQYSPNDLVKGAGETSTPDFPEVYLVEMTDRSFDDSGRLTHTLKARQVTYFKTADTTEGYIEQPELTFLSENSSHPWHLVANQGIADIEQQTLQLSGTVNAYSEHPRYGRLDVTTEDLLVNTHEQIATTDKPVTMQSARGTTSAVGLSADLDSGRVALLSEVKGIYAPD
ncbi:LPS export ABC transporter periplasmic protein LptC [Gilvimarinus agarilyticus]|uniref:LPS export ABC transporter periplasmic protein LptC n=1 Tax=unclassified Gilvimarinus TaxID=2642066 RepID=UPI001C0A235B|nr:MULTISPECIES: LPS export ABC transporter periplasmic protein LptC [unclassified Gilvimarinus]MBU2885444.1 LPS export ABC transporter periplasmic protein LptC [Gilvimarinus agarilyticus]MDO6570344.1 LPS export ABC transporter periplasmic protein LptC [Gilvimarinus sp. 2_MG-2023]MDO6746869.1 LPS export ABC transporter periplasmic protein LptC [Gilvimarinus sp. 1_MG-2023]